MPTVENFQVSTFTGAATFSLPIEVPAGPGGLQPSLTLSYNSQVVDQATLETQASWVGMGWSLETGSIEIDTAGTGHEFDDTYFLNVGGVSTRLVRDATNGYYYHAADENFWKFYYDSTTKTWTVWDKTGTKYYFENKISLSYLIDCDPGPNGGGGDASDPMPYKWVLTRVENIYHQVLTYTYVTETKVLHGEHYNGQQNCVAKDFPTDTAIYPESIIYPNGRYRIYFEREERRDYFSNWVTDGAHHSFERTRLKNIYIQYAANGTGFVTPPTPTSAQTVRRYQFDYESNSGPSTPIFPGLTYVWTDGRENGKVSTLSKVQEFGVSSARALPAHEFTYGDNLHLTRATNGYGGAVEFDYELWFYPTATVKDYTSLTSFGSTVGSCTNAGWAARDANSSVFVDCENPGRSLLVAGNAIQSGLLLKQIRPGGRYRITTSTTLGTGMSAYLGAFDGSQNNFSTASTTSGAMTHIFTLPANASQLRMLATIAGGSGHGRFADFKIELLPTFYRVKERRVSDEQGPIYTYSYSYTGAAVNDSDHADVCSLFEQDCEGIVEAYSEFRGHSQVTEVDPNGRKTVTAFFQDDIKKGQTDWIRIIDNATGRKLTESIYTTQSIPLPFYFLTSYDHIGFGRYWVYTTTIENRIYAVNGDSYTATLSGYTYNTNGDYSYGNLISQTEYSGNGRISTDEKSAWTKYRVTTNGYFPNATGVYLVGLPAYTTMFDGSGALIAQTLFFYDSHTNYTDLPTTGVLTDTRIWTGASGYLHTRYGHDGWGNQTTVTTYSGYNTVTTNTPPAGGRTNYTCYGGGGTLGGKACADDAVHTYPLWSMNPLGQTTSWMYDYALGAPLTESDPNDPNPALTTETYNTTITAQYDTFGRLIGLIRPGDDSANPTMWITYNDNVRPFRIDLQQRLEGTRYSIIRKYYDGMGRLLQNRIWNAQIAGQADNKLIVVNYEYDSAGRVTRQSAPSTLAISAAYSADFPSPTVTTYDALGRPRTVTGPDGNDVTYNYDGLSSIVTDANGHSTTTLNDEWGRVKTVTPSTGPSVSYSYDALDRLLTAARGGSTTTLSYDGAGRKTGMSDPDMGNWTYTYDALGNLTRQKDARDQRICLYYDLLNRLTAKHYRTDDSCPATQPASPDVLYTYDVGTYGKGQRTKTVNKVDGTVVNDIVSEWTYDARGRVKTEKVMGYTTTWGYNSADLPTLMVYPDSISENVIYTYNNQMLLNGVSGADNYVQYIGYDEASRVVERTLGNDQIQHYNYYAWNEKAAVNTQQIGQGGRLKNLNIGSLQNFTYVYDAVGNIRTITDSITNETQAFGYDSLSRLTSATVTGGPAPYTERYGYDAATGNLATKSLSPNPGTLQLAAWWSMDETAGTRADSHYGNHLADGNTVASTTGLKGKAASFVRANREYLSIPDNALLSGGDIDFTLVAHVYLNNNSDNIVLVDKSDNSAAYDYRLAHNPGTGFRFRVGADPAYVDSGVVTANTWHTVIAWHDSVTNTINLQVDNGTPVTKAYSGGTTDTNYPLYIGALNGTAGLDGKIDEVALYRRVLTTAERAWLYNSGQGRAYAEVATSTTYAYDTVTTDGDPAHPHAVASFSNNTYKYDNNGNQIKRVIGGVTYLLAYDAENRLIKVCEDTSLSNTCEASEEIAKFFYDADGKRVKSTIGNQTILFIGAHYEVTNAGTEQVITKYYFAGAQRVAMRNCPGGVCSAPMYLFSDHLGSTSLTTDPAGNKISEIRYTAWGNIRWTDATSMPTQYTFTGQYSDSYINLLWYGSRHYDPELGRFISPDSIVPTSVQGVQAWDRYAYTNNNPVRYTDPTGHCIGISNCLQKIQQISLATQFLVGRMLQKGELNLTEADWEDAANYAAPATADGSKQSLSGTASFGATGIVSVTYVTTDDGSGELYVETGGGLATPQLSLTATDGQIFGDDFTTASNYEGTAAQIFGGVGEVVGVSGEVWGAGDGSDIWGVDAGLSLGVPGVPPSLGVGMTNAKPADVALDFLENAAVKDFVHRITYHEWKGKELLVCRIAGGCGR